MGDWVDTNSGTAGTAGGRTWKRAGRLAAVLDILLVALLAGSLPVAGAGRPLDAAAVDPLPLLGAVLDTTGCHEAPLEVGEGMVVVCGDYTAITSPDGAARVVSVYGPGEGVAGEFRGRLPQGLAWGDALADVLDRLGRPDRITAAYGTPTLVYMYHGLPYGSLELRFDVADRLVRINACLTH